MCLPPLLEFRQKNFELFRHLRAQMFKFHILNLYLNECKLLAWPRVVGQNIVTPWKCEVVGGLKY